MCIMQFLVCVIFLAIPTNLTFVYNLYAFCQQNYNQIAGGLRELFSKLDELAWNGMLVQSLNWSLTLRAIEGSRSLYH